MQSSKSVFNLDCSALSHCDQRKSIQLHEKCHQIVIRCLHKLWYTTENNIHRSKDMPPMPTPIVTLAADRTDPSVVEYLTKPFLDVQQANPSLPLTPPALKAWSQEHGFDLAGSMNVNDTQGRPWAVGLGRFNTPKTQQQIEALGMLRMDYNMSLHDNAKRSLDKHNIARQI